MIVGYEIVQTIHLTKVVSRVVERTWKERWFSLPWHPFQKTKTVVESIPDPDMYTSGHTIFVHPATFSRFLEMAGDKIQHKTMADWRF